MTATAAAHAPIRPEHDSLAALRGHRLSHAVLRPSRGPDDDLRRRRVLLRADGRAEVHGEVAVPAGRHGAAPRGVGRHGVADDRRRQGGGRDVHRGVAVVAQAHLDAADAPVGAALTDLRGEVLSHPVDDGAGRRPRRGGAG